MIKRILANKIKQLRKEKNITQRALSDILGCDQAFISKIERGVSSFNLEHLEKICTALNYPIARLFEDDAYPQEEIPPGRVAQNQADPMEWALVEVFRGLSSRHKGKLLGVAEELRLAEAIPPKVSKKAGAAA